MLLKVAAQNLNLKFPKKTAIDDILMCILNGICFSLEGCFVLWTPDAIKMQTPFQSLRSHFMAPLIACFVRKDRHQWRKIRDY